MVKMRTRKHQSPAESGRVDKPKCEDGAKAMCETAPTPKIETANGEQSEPTETVDQKKANGKKQKKRRRSPRNKASPSKVDSALLGMMAEAVWVDKYVYDEAERSYHAQLAAAPEASPKATAVKHKTKNSAATGCSHSNMVACHHLRGGIWVNKFSFEDAESQFVVQFSSPVAPRTLNLSLVPPDRPLPRSSQTPDEGYASATPTPAAAPNPLTLNTVVSDPTVNGKPHWAGLRSLLSEGWLDKSLYDQAERRYYEHEAATRAEPNLPYWGHNMGKRGKKDKWSKKSAGKQPPARKKELTSIPEEGANALYYLHADSERVWLEKSAYDRAEENFYTAQSHKTPPKYKHPGPGKSGGKK